MTSVEGVAINEHEQLVSSSSSESNTPLETDIRRLLRILEAPSRGGGNGGRAEAKEGYLMKKNRKSSAWKRYWFRLDPSGGNLSYYRSKDNTRSAGVINLRALLVTQIREEDALALKQNESGEEVCKFRVSIFATRRHYLLSAETDVDMQSWIDALRATLSSRFSADEIREKENAAQELVPLVDEQVQLQIERYRYLNSVLAQTGFLSLDGPSKLKEGYLKLKLDDAEGNWQKAYFVLHKRYLNYYKLDDKSVPQGIIALKFIGSIEPIEGKSPNSRRFIIATPLRTYLLRAKHEVAMAEWINAIRTAKGKRDKETEPQLVPIAHTASDAPAIDGKKVLSYSINGKSKSFSFTRSITIGRASNNDLKLNDAKVSRNHAKIDVESGKAPLLCDLGSSRGTKVNNERVTQRALRVGDQIQIGSTVLTLEVKR